MSETTKENLEKINQHTKIAQRIVESALKEQKGYEYLRELCDIGPRLSGSENSMRAINWAFEKMNSLGFDKVWLQPVMVPHWERGDVESCSILDLNKQLSVLALGGSIATPPNGITAEVIEVKTFAELEKRKDEVKGKIVFFSRALDQGQINTFLSLRWCS